MAIDFEYSSHAADMMLERRIEREFVESTLQEPETVEDKVDGTRHYVKGIPAHEGRYLRVVVDPGAEPKKVVTVFFDRRLGRMT